MQVPNGSERFTFPNPQAPNSPPSTPESATSSQGRPHSFTPIAINKRHGLIGPIMSPPEHLEPVDGHNFSYTRQQRAACIDSESSDSDESDAVDSSIDDEDEGAGEATIELDAPEPPPSHAIPAPAAPVPPTAPPPPSFRRTSTATLSYDDSDVEFTIEEITEDDIGYDSDIEVLRPFHTEDAPSDNDECPTPADDESDIDSDCPDSLVDELENLRCDPREELRLQQAEFDRRRAERHARRKKRWSKGGNHKRNLTESLGSDSDTEDIVPLDDADMLGASARRLRRRTEGPDGRPRISLLFDDPPKEIEELKYLAEDGEVLDTDDERMLPTWMYPAMEVDSDSSDDPEPSPKTKPKPRRR